MESLRVTLEQLEDAKLAYVFERSKTTSNKRALRNAGMPESTFYSWPKSEQERLNQLAQELKRNRILAAEMVLLENAEEAAKVLASHASASLENFIRLDAGQPVLDLAKAQELDKLRLIKRLNYDKDGHLRSIEIHDAQSAAMNVLDRTAGRPVQKQEISGPGGEPIPFSLETWKKERRERTEEAESIEEE